MINESMGSNPDSVDKSIINPEQESIEQDINSELEQLAYGLDDIKGSLEKLDPSNNTPVYVKAVKKIWDGYKNIEGTVNLALMMHGASATGIGVRKILEKSNDDNNGVTTLIAGVATLSLAIAGFIHEEKNRKSKLETNA
jgi:hypothetical protein